MNFNQFVNIVKEEIKKQVPNGVGVDIHKTQKNNGVEKVGLIFSKGNANFAQTVYLEEAYENFQKGKKISSIVHSLLEIYENIRVPNTERFEEMMHYSNAKKKIIYRLVNAKKNKQLLKNVPHESFCDFAIVYYLLLGGNEIGNTMVLIQDSQREVWGITKEELRRVAQENTQKCMGIEFKSLNEIIREMIEEEEEHIQENAAYVLTNRIRSHGASVLLYDGIFEMVAKEMKGAYYIVPSSIHELIIVPEEENINLAELKDTVIKMNTTKVGAEEVLSDNVYYFNPVRGGGLQIV
jgi:hypothetical protein